MGGIVIAKRLCVLIKSSAGNGWIVAAEESSEELAVFVPATGPGDSSLRSYLELEEHEPTPITPEVQTNPTYYRRLYGQVFWREP